MFGIKHTGIMCLVLLSLSHSLAIGANNITAPVNQQQARADALHRVKMESRLQSMDIDYIKHRWLIKTTALKQLSQSAKARQTKVDLLASKERGDRQFEALNKTRVLTETQAVEKFLKERRKAEDLAIAAVVRQMENLDSNFRDKALRQAKQSIEHTPGSTKNNLINLPELEGALPMSYPHYLPPDPNQQFGQIQYAKTTNDKTGVPPAVGRLAESETARRLNAQTKNFNQAELRSARKKEALQKVVATANKVNEARKKEASKSKSQRLKELLNLYLSDKITAGDYYKQRAIIRADQ